MNVPLTISGLGLSGIVLFLNLRTWWRGKREIKNLKSFGLGALGGASLLLCVGGIFRWVAIKTVSTNSAAGGVVVSKATGVQGSGFLAHGSMGVITVAGAWILLLAIVGIGFIWYGANKVDRHRMLGGAYCGVTLCATAGIAHLMAWLPSIYNGLGGLIASVLSGKAL